MTASTPILQYADEFVSLLEQIQKTSHPVWKDDTNDEDMAAVDNMISRGEEEYLNNGGQQ